MSKRFEILIEDDWEVKGNGLGNVAQLQYLPSLYFMKLARRLGIKMTFMVDVAQQLIFNKYIEDDYNIKLQKNLWDDTVSLMKSYGFDVQLHLHPQWLRAKRHRDYFELDSNWNIGRLNCEDQEELIAQSVKYLHDLLRPMDSQYKVVGFKGGSWGLQPSRDLLKNLQKHGIRVIMGVRKGMYLPSNGVDYRELEEEIMPYYANDGDLCKISEQPEGQIVIPLQKVVPGFIGISKLVADMIKRRMSKKDEMRHYYDSEVPASVQNLSPIAKESKPKFPYLSYTTHLKIGNQPFSYLKRSFNQVIERLRRSDYSKIPILIECHTKQYDMYYDDIERFITYILNTYGSEVEFKTISEFLAGVEAKHLTVKSKTT